MGSQQYVPEQAGGEDSAKLGAFTPPDVFGPISSDGTHVFEDISVGDHGMQILSLPATQGWTAKRVTAGERAVQLVGSFSYVFIRDCLERIQIQASI